jgi:hypothetical protein
MPTGQSAALLPSLREGSGVGVHTRDPIVVTPPDWPSASHPPHKGEG